jgi:hypothetical protein
MHLGTAAGLENRLVQIFFVDGDVKQVLDRNAPLHRPGRGRRAFADLRLVAPFYRTVVGTDTYVDQLW